MVFSRVIRSIRSITSLQPTRWMAPPAGRSRFVAPRRVPNPLESM
jgi:hypothetical protein